MRPTFALALAAAAVCAAGSALGATPRLCPDGMKPASTAELFGRTGDVSDADWRAFLHAEVTPRFPDGLSISDVYGERRSAAGAFLREDGKAFLIVLAGRPDDQQRLGLVRDAYTRRFHQPSALHVEEKACVSSF